MFEGSAASLCGRRELPSEDGIAQLDTATRSAPLRRRRHVRGVRAHRPGRRSEHRALWRRPDRRPLEPGLPRLSGLRRGRRRTHELSVDRCTGHRVDRRCGQRGRRALRCSSGRLARTANTTARYRNGSAFAAARGSERGPGVTRTRHTARRPRSHRTASADDAFVPSQSGHGQARSSRRERPGPPNRRHGQVRGVRHVEHPQLAWLAGLPER